MPLPTSWPHHILPCLLYCRLVGSCRADSEEDKSRILASVNNLPKIYGVLAQMGGGLPCTLHHHVWLVMLVINQFEPNGLYSVPDKSREFESQIV